MVFFLLVKRAKSLKHIKKILYVTVQQANLNNPLMKNFSEKKMSFRNKYGCWDNISYIELVLIKSNNNYQDKKIASYAIQYFLIDDNECRQNRLIRKVAIDVCKLYLQNRYIEKDIKAKIYSYLSDLEK